MPASSTRAIRLFLIDDHALFRDGLARLCENSILTSLHCHYLDPLERGAHSLHYMPATMSHHGVGNR